MYWPFTTTEAFNRDTPELTKGDAPRACLQHHVSHYTKIGDVRPVASLFTLELETSKLGACI
jgi:hypothetical protein